MADSSSKLLERVRGQSLRIRGTHEYELVRQIGEGGFGAVYLARQMPTEVACAVKVSLCAEVSNGALARHQEDRFRREIEVGARLAGEPGLAYVMDSGVFTVEERTYPFLVMPYYSNVLPLDEWFDVVHDLALRVWVVQLAARRIMQLHARGFIHRDVKPANVLIADSAHGPQATLIDFGLAKAVDAGALPDDPCKSLETQTLGTLAYMAPEAVNAADGSIGTKADAYSLGVMLFEAMFGDGPYGDMTNGASRDFLGRLQMGTLDRADPRTHEGTRGDVPAELREVCVRALEWDPAKRASVADVAADLHAWWKALVTPRVVPLVAPTVQVPAPVPSPPPASSPPRPAEAGGVQRVAFAASVALAFLVGLGLVWMRVDLGLRGEQVSTTLGHRIDETATRLGGRIDKTQAKLDRDLAMRDAALDLRLQEELVAPATKLNQQVVEMRRLLESQAERIEAMARALGGIERQLEAVPAPKGEEKDPFGRVIRVSDVLLYVTVPKPEGTVFVKIDAGIAGTSSVGDVRWSDGPFMSVPKDARRDDFGRRVIEVPGLVLRVPVTPQEVSTWTMPRFFVRVSIGPETTDVTSEIGRAEPLALQVAAGERVPFGTRFVSGELNMAVELPRPVKTRAEFARDVRKAVEGVEESELALRRALDQYAGSAVKIFRRGEIPTLRAALERELAGVSTLHRSDRQSLIEAVCARYLIVSLAGFEPEPDLASKVTDGAQWPVTFNVELKAGSPGSPPRPVQAAGFLIGSLMGVGVNVYESHGHIGDWTVQIPAESSLYVRIRISWQQSQEVAWLVFRFADDPGWNGESLATTLSGYNSADGPGHHTFNGTMTVHVRPER